MRIALVALLLGLAAPLSACSSAPERESYTLVLHTHPQVTGDTVDHPTNAAIYVRFGSTLDAGTLSDSVRVEGPDGRAQELTFELMATEVLIRPKTLWPASARLTVTLKPSLQDTMGNRLPGNYTWAFVTGAGPDVAPLEVTSAKESGAGFPGGSLEFNKAVNPISARAHVDLAGSPGAPPFTDILWVDDKHPTIVYASAYGLSCPYEFDCTLTALAGLEDLSGNKLAAPVSVAFHASAACEDAR